MMEFIRRLGKKIQELLDKIFGKKDKKPQNHDTKSWTRITNTDSEVFLDGVPLGKVESITSISKEDISEEAWESLKSIFGDGEINCGWVEIPLQPEIQKNFFNIPLTLLPKRIPCRAIILSLAANQQSDYQAVDMSQYEERRIAHLIIGRACGLEELMCEYMCDCVAQEEQLDEEDIEWMKEEVARCKESGLFSALIPNATLLHYEALGVWDFEEDE
jgi:hypothetical protein